MSFCVKGEGRSLATKLQLSPGNCSDRHGTNALNERQRRNHRECFYCRIRSTIPEFLRPPDLPHRSRWTRLATEMGRTRRQFDVETIMLLFLVSFVFVTSAVLAASATAETPNCYLNVLKLRPEPRECFDCKTYAFLSVMHYYGADVTFSDVCREAGRPPKTDFTPAEDVAFFEALLTFVKTRGFSIEVHRWSLNEILAEVARGRPVIANYAIPPSPSEPAVIKGFNDAYVWLYGVAEAMMSPLEDSVLTRREFEERMDMGNPNYGPTGGYVPEIWPRPFNCWVISREPVPSNRGELPHMAKRLVFVPDNYRGMTLEVDGLASTGWETVLPIVGDPRGDTTRSDADLTELRVFADSGFLYARLDVASAVPSVPDPVYITPNEIMYSLYIQEPGSSRQFALHSSNQQVHGPNGMVGRCAVAIGDTIEFAVSLDQIGSPTSSVEILAEARPLGSTWNDRYDDTGWVLFQLAESSGTFGIMLRHRYFGPFRDSPRGFTPTLCHKGQL